MARARARLDWDVGAAIVAKIHNTHIRSSSQAIRPDRINPIRLTEPSRGPRMPAESIIDGLDAMYGRGSGRD